jgi:transposase
MSEEYLGDGSQATPENGIGVPQRDGPTSGADGSESGQEPGGAYPPVPPGEWGEFTPKRPLEQDEIVEILPEDLEAAGAEDCLGARPSSVPPLAGGRRRKQRVLHKEPERQPPRVTPEQLTPTQRLLLLDTWQRSGLPASDFAALVGVSNHTLYLWKRKFDQEGPGGLMEKPRGGPPGSRLPELTRRTILMLKQANPEWGCQRISDLLLRGPALPASAGAVARVLKEAGYEVREEPTRPHPDHVVPSSAPVPTNCGRPTCSLSCSSGKTGACTWWPSWTTIAGSWSAMDCTPVNRRR